MKHLPHALARSVSEKTSHLFKPKFGVFYAMTVGSAILMILLLLLAEQSHAADEIAVILILTAIVSIPGTLCALHALRVEVKPDSILSTDYWCVRHSLTWAEIDRAESVMVFGFPYLKVESFRKDHRPLYVPLYLADNEAFREKVIRTAAPTNPLRQALENRTGVAARAKANE